MNSPGKRIVWTALEVDVENPIWGPEDAQYFIGCAADGRDIGVNYLDIAAGLADEHRPIRRRFFEQGLQCGIKIHGHGSPPFLLCPWNHAFSATRHAGWPTPPGAPAGP